MALANCETFPFGDFDTQSIKMQILNSCDTTKKNYR